MNVLTVSQIQEADACTIKNEPIRSVDLMERAATTLSSWIRKRFTKKTDLIFFAGKGNNGGDAWALARILYFHGYKNIRFYVLGDGYDLSKDSLINKQRLINETDIAINCIVGESDFPFLSESEWVIDGLFGIGLSRPVDGLIASLIGYINASPKSGVIAIDIPSGLSGDNTHNSIPGDIIEANYTLSFQVPKLSFFFAENDLYLGDWHILPIGLDQKTLEQSRSGFHVITKSELRCIVRSRPKFSHKGTYGHALVVAGNFGMMGAAVLALRAAVKGGAGLVTAHVPRMGYNIVQTTVPECLVSLDESELMFTDVLSVDSYSAIAVGPAINTKTNTVRGLKALINNCHVPLVIDADALNILSENKDWLKKMPEKTIVTPHPGEFDRLTKKHSTHYERVLTQIDFAKTNRLVVILKGAHTTVALPNGDVWFNKTGNAGMATGGSGDILTGLLCSLLAQGYDVKDAALLAVYAHGLAGDLALKKVGYHALIASDIIDNLGRAFIKLEK